MALNISLNSIFQLHVQESDTNDSCSSTDDSWHARGAAGVTCLLITLILLCELLCDHRAYKTTLQRLVLYYTVFSFLYQILNSVNGIAHNHSRPSPGDLTPLETAAMYFANAAFFLPAVIINYLMSLILRICCGCHITYPQSKLRIFFTELLCLVLGILPSLLWIPVNMVGSYKHFSFDVFYTVYASGCQSMKISDQESILAVALSGVIISEMVAAVIVLNIAHYRVRLQVRGQQVLALERKTHLIVTTVALIYVFGIIVSFPLCLLEAKDQINWNESEIFLAIWFPTLNQCNLFILYVASIRTTNHPLFCLQRKKLLRKTSHTDMSHQTNPSSHPFEQPSQTRFTIRYTGGFTDITETSGVYCDDASSSAETIPLLRAGRYESHADSAQTDCSV